MFLRGYIAHQAVAKETHQKLFRNFSLRIPRTLKRKRKFKRNTDQSAEVPTPGTITVDLLLRRLITGVIDPGYS
jgi:hypothetical protein